MSSETEYRVERSGDNGITWAEIAVLPANSTAYTDNNVECERVYNYRVRAYRSQDSFFTDYTDMATATTSTCPVVRLMFTGCAAIGRKITVIRLIPAKSRLLLRPVQFL